MDSPVTRREQAMRQILPVLIAATLLTACGSLHRKGGYYEDDGPPKRSPVDLTSISDAVPREEPRSPYGNEPYTVSGKIYYPLVDANGYQARGVASWYGKKFHGRRTSSGERYDMYAMTAAHKTLPLPTYVQVRNLHNGRSVTVRVNDRGPFLRNRLIDLSYAAAAKLGIVSTGTGMVEVRAVGPTPANAVTPSSRPGETGAIGAVAEQKSSARLYLQVGAFTDWENAERLRSRLSRAQLGPIRIYGELQNNVHFYRVRIGPLGSIEESHRLAERAAEHGIVDARIIIE